MAFDYYRRTLLFEIPFAEEFSVFMGVSGCGRSILWRMAWIDPGS